MNEDKERTTLIKHSPNTALRLQVENETVFLVKSSTPHVSALKRINKMLDKFDKTINPSLKHQRGEYKKVRYISVKGLGRAIEKTLALGVVFQTKLNYKVDVLTSTVEVMDEIRVKNAVSNAKDEDSDDEDEDARSLQVRSTSCVEVRIWLKRD